MEVTFTIPEEKKQRVIDAMKELYPIPQVPVDPEDPSQGTQPKFTDAQWAKEAVRRIIVRKIFRYEKTIAMQAIEKDDEIIQ